MASHSVPTDPPREGTDFVVGEYGASIMSGTDRFTAQNGRVNVFLMDGHIQSHNSSAGLHGSSRAGPPHDRPVLIPHHRRDSTLKKSENNPLKSTLLMI